MGVCISVLQVPDNEMANACCIISNFSWSVVTDLALNSPLFSVRTQYIF